MKKTINRNVKSSDTFQAPIIDATPVFYCQETNEYRLVEPGASW